MYPLHRLPYLITALAALTGCGLDYGAEPRESYYPTHADAITDGALTRGWIPDVFPASATEIHEFHVTDDPSVWIKCTVSPDCLIDIESRFKEVDKESMEFPHQPRAIIQWWPKELTNTSTQLTGYRYFRASTDRGSSFYIAAKHNSSEAYAWSP